MRDNTLGLYIWTMQFHQGDKDIEDKTTNLSHMLTGLWISYVGPCALQENMIYACLTVTGSKCSFSLRSECSD